MGEPFVEVLGVYRLPVTEELFREQLELLYDVQSMTPEELIEAEQRVRDQLSSVVLIEAIVHNRDERFDVGDFTQPMDGVPRDRWQVAYAEVFLTLDGNAYIGNCLSDVPEAKDLRIAFFIHFWQPDKPLYTSYGEVFCPPVQEMPARLARLVSYEPVD